MAILEDLSIHSWDGGTNLAYLHVHMLNFPKFARLHETKVHAKLYMVAVVTKLKSQSLESLKTCFCIVKDDWNWN
jgi:hypothetical protein